MLDYSTLYRAYTVWREQDPERKGYIQAPEFFPMADQLGVKPDSLRCLPFRHGGISFRNFVGWLVERSEPFKHSIHGLDLAFHCAMLYDKEARGILQEEEYTMLILDAELNVNIDLLYSQLDKHNTQTVETLDILFWVFTQLHPQQAANISAPTQTTSTTCRMTPSAAMRTLPQGTLHHTFQVPTILSDLDGSRTPSQSSLGFSPSQSSNLSDWEGGSLLSSLQSSERVEPRTPTKRQSTGTTTTRSKVLPWLLPIFELYNQLGQRPNALVDKLKYDALTARIHFLPAWIDRVRMGVLPLRDILLMVMDYCRQTDYGFYPPKRPAVTSPKSLIGAHSQIFYRQKEPTTPTKSTINGRTSRRSSGSKPQQHKLEVVVVRADIDKENERGAGGTDVYVKVSYGNSAEYRTQYCRRTTSPWWNQKFQFYIRDPENDTLTVRMFEKCPHWGKKEKPLGGAVTIDLCGLEKGTPQEVQADTNEGMVHLKLLTQTFGSLPTSPIGVWSPDIIAMHITKLDSENFHNVGIHLWCNELLNYVLRAMPAEEPTSPTSPGGNGSAFGSPTSRHRGRNDKRPLWTQHAQYKLSVDGVSNLVSRFNHLSRVVSTDIVSVPDLQERQRKLGGWISVAEECSRLNNWNAVTAIINAMTAAPISRLTRTWKGIRGLQHTFESLVEDVSVSSNYDQQRRRMWSTQGPLVPFLGVMLADLTEAVRTPTSELLDPLNRNNRAVEVSEQYRRCQQHRHHFAQERMNQDLFTILTETKPWEEDELMVASLQCEVEA
eukprot:TRINITY_DN74718_c0_g1_i1.p1 TRINITY_DN74718_c0_g1~~TRINITY_DN74718_c0_g1_i1.p1  ORF type:complete len:776 (+),score=76.46 TRINITY_DN74718_c0_g1_i1:94-2421(+)